MCDDENPASFTITVTMNSLVAGTTYTIGTDVGPVTPFSGTFPGTGPYTVTLTFTTLEVPPPANVVIEVSYDVPGGGKCFQKATVKVPSCSWIDERTADTTNPGTTPSLYDPLTGIATALMVFPNPASGTVTISYDYGSDLYADRALEVYDMMGRKVETSGLVNLRGSWALDIGKWVPGIYIVRMEGNGKTLHMQRVVISK